MDTLSLAEWQTQAEVGSVSRYDCTTKVHTHAHKQHVAAIRVRLQRALSFSHPSLRISNLRVR